MATWKRGNCIQNAWGATAEINLTQLLAYMGPAVRYEDVSGTAVFVRHDGIREMTESASQMSSDLRSEILSGVCDGRTFAFESIGSGTNTGASGPSPPGAVPLNFGLPQWAKSPSRD